MVSRNQSQAAADAAALSGAHALSYDGTLPGDRWDRARNVAWNAGTQHGVWGDAPGVVPTSPYGDISICEATPQSCVRVDVFRDGTNGSGTLPTWFAGLFGVNSQRIRAMAIAQTSPASGTDCLKPWLVPDRFVDNTSSPTTFDVGDVYERPVMDENGVMNNGTGYTPADAGTTMTLKVGDPHEAMAPGNFYTIDDPEFAIVGGKDYSDAIAECVIRRNIGEIVSIKDGNMKGPTKHGFDQLIAAGEEERPELVRESFFRQAITGPDQLRQRVAFALSEIFVVSDRDADVRRAPEGLASYFDAPYPARATYQVAALPRGARIEVEATLVLPGA
jgi:hypothetical protein